MIFARSLLLAFLATLFVSNVPAATTATTQAGNHDYGAANAVFPQQRAIQGFTLTIHAPQVRSWTGFEHFTSTIAFSLTPSSQTEAQYGTATVAGDTVVDMDRRIVTIRSPRVTDVTFAEPVPAKYTAAVMDAATRESLDVRLDLFLAHLADEVLSQAAPAGFNTSPPPILVRSTPAALLFVNGAPVPSAVPNTGLEVIVNANWPLYRDAAGSGTYYLLARDRWLTSAKLDHGWKVATSLPRDFANLPSSDEYAAVRKAVPLQKSTLAPPQVVFADRPTELIVTDGKPALEAIPGTGGLHWVTNTESPLFKLESNWYLLVAGRWFTTANLDKGPWTFSKDLPKAFSAIPEDHTRSAVRASVPGTVEARMAALEASVPRKIRVTRGSPPAIDVTYAGDPKFEAIPGTQVARAVNSGFDVLLYQNRFYLCYAAGWYVADSPKGPWGATADVPAAIYAIPPDSPSYAVTDVKVTESSEDEIEYSSTDAYAAGVFLAFGVAYYGTGWYYPPYIYGPIYYPYWGSYGHGSWYNPATGRYGSRSVWYGPYGGYSYTQGYNPRTGRYGYVETAWDGDEWTSFGGTYNPRTGIGTKTERYYDEDQGRLETERTVERGGEWVQSERTTDFDDRTTKVERETSQGGSSEVQRSRDGGTVSSERTVTSGDGNTYTMSGEQSLGRGSSTITGADGSITTDTVRNDGRSATVIEGSGGGKAISISGEDPGRTTVGQSGSGDTYAGYNGNIYKKTDGGWQRYDTGQWKPAESSPYVPRERPSPAPKVAPAGPAASTPVAPATPAPTNDRGSLQQRPIESREREQLERDYSARQRGDRQFHERSTRGGGGRSRGR
jgi:hypothetical protein